MEHVSTTIGTIARPADVRFCDILPKTRSGKIMRRLLRELAHKGGISGDTTTLEDMAVIERIAKDTGQGRRVASPAVCGVSGISARSLRVSRLIRVRPRYPLESRVHDRCALYILHAFEAETVCGRGGSSFHGGQMGRFGRLITLIATAALSSQIASAQARTDWPMYGHDLASTRFSPLSQINADNVAKLAVAWSYPMRPGGAGPAGGAFAR